MKTTLVRAAIPRPGMATNKIACLGLAGLLLLSPMITTASAAQTESPRHAFTNWLERYRQAWLHRDPSQVTALFSGNARYYETPFDKPMIGRKSIYDYWSQGVKSGQRDITFHADVLDATRSRGLAHWHATFTRLPAGNHVELDGVLQASFNAAGQCTEFREWWHRSESAPR